LTDRDNGVVGFSFINDGANAGGWHFTVIAYGFGATPDSLIHDNGDGTYSIVTQNSGPSPIFKLPNGGVVWRDVGLIQFRLTFDQATGDFVAFEVTRVSGPREAGCNAIVAALT